MRVIKITCACDSIECIIIIEHLCINGSTLCVSSIHSCIILFGREHMYHFVPWFTATAAQLNQECSNEALRLLSTKIVGYSKYKHKLSLSSADIDEIDNDPRNFNSAHGKLHAALLKWKSKSIDLDNPSNSTATYGRLVEIAKEDKDGEAIREIHKACVKYTSKLPIVHIHALFYASLLIMYSIYKKQV